MGRGTNTAALPAEWFALSAWALRPAQGDSQPAAARDCERARRRVVNSGTVSGKVLIYQPPAADDWAARRARAPRPQG